MLKEEFDLEKLLLMDDTYYQRVIHPIMYNYIKDIDIFRRNAAAALGNSRDAIHIPALEKALSAYATVPMVHECIVWALERIGGGQAREALQRSLHSEQPENILQGDFNEKES